MTKKSKGKGKGGRCAKPDFTVQVKATWDSARAVYVLKPIKGGKG